MTTVRSRISDLERKSSGSNLSQLEHKEVVGNVNPGSISEECASPKSVRPSEIESVRKSHSTRGNRTSLQETLSRSAPDLKFERWGAPDDTSIGLSVSSWSAAAPHHPVRRSQQDPNGSHLAPVVERTQKAKSTHVRKTKVKASDLGIKIDENMTSEDLAEAVRKWKAEVKGKDFESQEEHHLGLGGNGERISDETNNVKGSASAPSMDHLDNEQPFRGGSQPKVVRSVRRVRSKSQEEGALSRGTLQQRPSSTSPGSKNGETDNEAFDGDDDDHDIRKTSKMARDIAAGAELNDSKATGKAMTKIILRRKSGTGATTDNTSVSEQGETSGKIPLTATQDGASLPKRTVVQLKKDGTNGHARSKSAGPPTRARMAQQQEQRGRSDIPPAEPLAVQGKQMRSASPEKGRSVSPDKGRSVSPDKGRSVSPDKGRSISPDKGRSISPDKGRMVMEARKSSRPHSPQSVGKGQTNVVAKSQIRAQDLPAISLGLEDSGTNEAPLDRNDEIFRRLNHAGISVEQYRAILDAGLKVVLA